MTDFQAENGEQSVTLEGGQMAKLLRYIVHTLEIFMWEQNYCLNPDEDDFFTDILPDEDIYVDVLEKKRGGFANGTGGQTVLAGAGGIQ